MQLTKKLVFFFERRVSIRKITIIVFSFESGQSKEGTTNEHVIQVHCFVREIGIQGKLLCERDTECLCPSIYTQMLALENKKKSFAGVRSKTFNG